MSKLENNPEAATAHFNRIYDKTFDEIKVYIASKCADVSYVSDILQETYYEYYKLLLKNLNYAENPRAVLFKIAKRRVFRFYSLRQKLSTLIPMFSVNADGEEYCVADEMSEDGGEEVIIGELDAERVWNIINTYPAEVRKIMYLYFCCGMSHSQIAAQLGCGLSCVKNKLYRTIAEIREKEKMS